MVKSRVKSKRFVKMKLVSNEEKKIRSSTGQKNEKKITYADIIFNDTRLI